MLECRGVVRPLGKPAVGTWQIKFAKGGIPYVTDSAGSHKKWAMAVFQEAEGGRAEADIKPVKFSLDHVDDSDEEPGKGPGDQTCSLGHGTPKAAVKDVKPSGQDDMCATVAQVLCTLIYVAHN